MPSKLERHNHKPALPFVAITRIFSLPKQSKMHRLSIIAGLFTCTFFFSGNAQVPTYVPSDGLVLFMDFDSNVNDASGTGNDGTPHGVQYTIDRFGSPGKSAEFGSSSWIEIQHSSSINFALGDSLTWSIWIQTSPSSVGQTIFHKWNGIIQTTGYPLAASCGLGESLSSASFCANNQSAHGQVATSLVTGNWIHALMTQTPDSTILYIDGFPVDTGLINQTGCSNSTSLTIGRKFGVYPRYYEGIMDEFGIWNRVLTEEEIQALYLSEQILGCTDSTACNYSTEATLSDDSCIPSGCTDSLACNYSQEAGCDDGSCDYSCCPGPGCCGPGTSWDYEQSVCVIDYPTDVDFDGCTGVADVLEVLSLFGQCWYTPEIDLWACGDPLNYWNYDYATVQIGDQCWFAENLRSEHYRNGDLIPSNLSDSLWSSTNAGATAVYGDGNSTVIWGSGNEEQNLVEFGRLYNWHACSDDRNLCPTGWHVSDTSDFNALTSWASNSGIDSLAVRLRHNLTWAYNAISTDELGFGWKAGGNKTSGGAYNSLTLYGEIMVSDCPCWAELKYDWNQGFAIEGIYGGANMAGSVRCIKD